MWMRLLHTRVAEAVSSPLTVLWLHLQRRPHLFKLAPFYTRSQRPASGYGSSSSHTEQHLPLYTQISFADIAKTEQTKIFNWNFFESPAKKKNIQKFSRRMAIAVGRRRRSLHDRILFLKWYRILLNAQENTPPQSPFPPLFLPCANVLTPYGRPI